MLISNNFKNIFSNLAEYLHIKLLKPDKYNLKSARSVLNQFKSVLKLLEKLSEGFLKYGSDILPVPVSVLCNLSIYWRVFSNAFKVTKLKRIFKKEKKNDPST